jgi:hypothetical protein
MIDPTITGDVSMYYGLLGAVIGAAGSLLGGFGKKKSADATARGAAQNAQLVRERGRIEGILQEREGIKATGATKADFAASGLTLGGSAADVLRESARDIAFDAQNIKRLTNLEAEVFDAQAGAAKTAGKIGAVGGILGAVGKFF